MQKLAVALTSVSWPEIVPLKWETVLTTSHATWMQTNWRLAFANARFLSTVGANFSWPDHYLPRVCASPHTQTPSFMRRIFHRQQLEVEACFPSRECPSSFLTVRRSPFMALSDFLISSATVALLRHAEREEGILVSALQRQLWKMGEWSWRRLIGHYQASQLRRWKIVAAALCHQGDVGHLFNMFWPEMEKMDTRLRLFVCSKKRMLHTEA